MTYLLLLGLLPIGTQTLANSGSELGKAYYQQVCASCHGIQGEGNESLGSPALASQHHLYLTRQLNNFKNGLRGSDEKDLYGQQMVAIAAMANDAEINIQVSIYLSNLSAPSVLPIEGDLKNGYKYYQASCGSCHGAKAEGNELLNAPRLAGLSASYLERQHVNFISGLRGSHPDDRLGRQMKMMADTMTDQTILNDVIAYITSISVAK